MWKRHSGVRMTTLGPGRRALKSTGRQSLMLPRNQRVHCHQIEQRLNVTFGISKEPLLQSSTLQDGLDGQIQMTDNARAKRRNGASRHIDEARGHVKKVEA